MTNILALDASTELCSVALLQNGHLLEEMSDQPRSHADKLLPMVDSVLAQAGIKLRDVDAIAFGAGPGSFTGLRICLGVVQGLAFGADLPVVGVSSLEAMALATKNCHPAQELFVAAIDARMSEVYWAAYTASDSGVRQAVAPQVAPIDKAEKYLQQLISGRLAAGAGTGWALLPESRKLLQGCDEKACPQAAAVAYLGKCRFEGGHWTNAMSAEPVYLRSEITWKKRERIRGQ